MGTARGPTGLRWRAGVAPVMRPLLANSGWLLAVPVVAGGGASMLRRKAAETTNNTTWTAAVSAVHGTGVQQQLYRNNALTPTVYTEGSVLLYLCYSTARYYYKPRNSCFV